MLLRRMSVYLLFPVLCVYLYAGLDGIFSTFNPLSLSEPQGELVFQRGARAHTEPLFSVTHGAGIQIDLSFEYDRSNLDRGGVIFVYTGPSSEQPLILWQWKNQLILMSGDDYNARLRKPRVWVDLPEDTAGPYAVSILLSRQSLRLSVIGDEFSGFKTLNRPFPYDSENIRVVLGTNQSHRFPWAGKIHSFSLSAADTRNAALNSPEPVFRFDKSNLRASAIDAQGYIVTSEGREVKLYVGSSHPEFEHQRLQSITSRLQQQSLYSGDLLLNFAGFFPLGILIFCILSARGFGLALAGAVTVSFILSLCIELVQLTIPSRDPSQMDLLLNTVGGAVGALLMASLLAVLHRRKSRRI